MKPLSGDWSSAPPPGSVASFPDKDSTMAANSASPSRAMAHRHWPARGEPFGFALRYAYAPMKTGCGDQVGCQGPDCPTRLLRSETRSQRRRGRVRNSSANFGDRALVIACGNARCKKPLMRRSVYPESAEGNHERLTLRQAQGERTTMDLANADLCN